MLALLHAPSGQIVKLPYATGKPPSIDLEFVYKFEFYKGMTKHGFSAWLEKLQAKIIAESMLSKDIFLKANPMFKGAEVFMIEFELVRIDEPTGYPKMDYAPERIKEMK